jgi:hypothetical protein
MKDVSHYNMESEVSTITVVRQSTRIPVPQIYAFDRNSNCAVKAPFMFMECLDGNVGMDLGMDIPPEYQPDFFKKASGDTCR